MAIPKIKDRFESQAEKLKIIDPGSKSVLKEEGGYCLTRVGGRILLCAVLAFELTLLFGGGCALFVTRPVQEMSFTAASIRAAKDVQADTLAPELLRQSLEFFTKARREYKIKNFQLALEYAKKSRRFAEQAEFESLKNGGIRSDQASGDPLIKDPIASDGQGSGGSITPPVKPEDYPIPTGTPAEDYDRRKAAEDLAKKQASTPNSPSAGTPNPTPQSGLTSGSGNPK